MIRFERQTAAVQCWRRASPSIHVNSTSSPWSRRHPPPRPTSPPSTTVPSGASSSAPRSHARPQSTPLGFGRNRDERGESAKVSSFGTIRALLEHPWNKTLNFRGVFQCLPEVKAIESNHFWSGRWESNPRPIQSNLLNILASLFCFASNCLQLQRIPNGRHRLFSDSPAQVNVVLRCARVGVAELFLRDFR